MKSSITGCIAAFFATGAIGAPASAWKTPFTETCNNIRLQWGSWTPWLVADCLTGNGNERITSTMFLAAKIRDNNGGYPNVDLNWSWMEGKEHYWSFCHDCTIVGSNMTCACNHKGSPYGLAPSTIDLGDHIFNYDGHLLSNLAGEPSVIPPVSQEPPPDPNSGMDVEWHMSVAPNLTCATYSSVGGPGWQAGTHGPAPCTAFYNLPFLEVFSVKPNYNIYVYSTTDCKEGSEILTISDKRVCHELKGYPGSGGFKAEPKWNWG